MHKYKKLIPLIAVVLIAFGVNLDQFGIDLQKLSGQSGQQGQHSSQSSNNTNTQQSQTNTAATGNKTSRPAAHKGQHWSDTSPKINLRHVFEGEINRKGKPVGYHSRPGGIDPSTARVKQIKSGPNRAGIYTATIEIRDGNQWKEKFSSFFPDSMNDSEVIDAILHAYTNSKDPKKQPWSGPSGLGFNIQGYTLSRGDINTAFPVYVR